MSNAQIVGKFVADDARQRLLAIEDPAWGEAYRRYVAGLVAYEVEPTADGVIIRVGVAKGKSGGHHGLYIELGSRTAAAHPFLRPAVFLHQREIVALLTGK